MEATKKVVKFRKKEDIYEKCVVCDSLTSTPKDLHVDFRHFYTKGAGELCFKCAK